MWHLQLLVILLHRRGCLLRWVGYIFLLLQLLYRLKLLFNKRAERVYARGAVVLDFKHLCCAICGRCCGGEEHGRHMGDAKLVHELTVVAVG